MAVGAGVTSAIFDQLSPVREKSTDRKRWRLSRYIYTFVAGGEGGEGGARGWGARGWGPPPMTGGVCPLNRKWVALVSWTTRSPPNNENNRRQPLNG